MRFDFRKAIAWSSAVTLIFWCSCERHHVGELPDEHATAETKTATEEHASSDQPATPTHSHTTATPDPRNSPANFFPDKPKP